MELMVAVAVILVGLLAFSRALTGALALGERNRQTALATAAAQGVLERLYAADIERAFALYNDHPDDDPDGSGSAPGATFEVAGLDDPQGRILFPSPAGSPGELREDFEGSKLLPARDLDLDGLVDDLDHSADYRVLPVVVRVAWREGRTERELEVATILGAR